MTEPSPTHDADVSKHPSYKMFTFVALVMPAAGLVLGLYCMMQDEPMEKALGSHSLKYAIVGALVWSVGYVVLPPLMS